MTKTLNPEEIIQLLGAEKLEELNINSFNPLELKMLATQISIEKGKKVSHPFTDDDLKDIIFTEVKNDNMTLKFKEPYVIKLIALEGYINEDDGSTEYVLAGKDDSNVLSLVSFADTRQQLIKDFEWEITFLYEQFVIVDRKLLAESAIEYRDLIISLFE